jgi:hypothetical protein
MAAHAFLAAMLPSIEAMIPRIDHHGVPHVMHFLGVVPLF